MARSATLAPAGSTRCSPCTGPPSGTWARNPPAGGSPGTWKPDPEAYGNFAKALATRYSGNYGGLPAVHKFEAWNEPNIPLFLSPQYEGGTPFAAEWYRGLLNSFRAGVHGSEQEEQGDFRGDGSVRGPPRGPAHSAPRLPPPAVLSQEEPQGSQVPGQGVLRHRGTHPITIGGGPTQHAINRDDAATADFPEIRATLRAAERHHTVKPRVKGRPLWATEIWWETNPPDNGPGAVSLAKQAKFLQQSIVQLFDQGPRS